MKDIEIKNVEVKQVAMQTKRTVYVAVWWNSGVPYFGVISETKDIAERYAHDMAKHSDHVEILKFEVQVPNPIKNETTN